ncbi:hypothetical protein HK100_011410 [Physocladia obscura]|uniref:DUF541 domain-containing protein n=1 Tax=Physocladia obscura TaxID=109957 RepID=A0AAD5T1G2_9FUNG|nr:hypothetical protein HK100_011410 [Physocladia obscura]
MILIFAILYTALAFSDFVSSTVLTVTGTGIISAYTKNKSKHEHKNFNTQNKTGTTSIPADFAEIAISVDFVAKNALSAQKQTSTTANKVLKALGFVNASKIITSSVSLSANYDNSNNPSLLTGFTSSIGISFRTTPSKAGDAIDTCISTGADSIQSISFIASDENNTAAGNKATYEAIQNAISEATAVSSQLKLCVAKIKSINLTNLQAPPIPFSFSLATEAVGAKVSSTPIQPGALTVSASVDLVFELADC